jgi:octaprenyl-diphosphate synthase
MAVGTPAQRALLRKAIEEGGREQLDRLGHRRDCVDGRHYLYYAACGRLRERAKLAFELLPAGPATEAQWRRSQSSPSAANIDRLPVRIGV